MWAHSHAAALALVLALAAAGCSRPPAPDRPPPDDPRPPSDVRDAGGRPGPVEPPDPPDSPAPPPHCPASGIETLATGERYPSLIAVGSERVYWLVPEGIRAMPRTGGPAATVLELRTLRSLIASGNDLFYADHGARQIGRVRGDGTREVLVPEANADDFALAGGYLYWSQASPDNVIHSGAREGSISRIPLAGGQVELVVSGLEHPMRLAANAEAVFFSSGTGGVGIHRFTLGSGALQRVSDRWAVNLAADPEGAYFVDDLVYPRALMRIPNQGRTVTLVGGLGSSGAVAADASGVYVLSGSGRLSQLAPGATELRTLATDLDAAGEPGSLALDDEAVYLTVPSAGAIVRVDKRATGGCAPTGACPAPVGDPAAIAATPREDTGLEALAIRLDGELTARQSTYDRLVADVAAIRRQLPGVTVRYRPLDDGQTLWLSVTEPAGQAMEAGTYDAWDCLNDFYGLEAARVHYSTLGDRWSVTLTLKGIYDTQQLAERYALLPGVLQAQGALGGTDGPTLCAAREGETYEYVVDDRTGDCPAGCTATTAYHFTSRAPGEVEPGEVWGSALNDDAPAWYAICRGF